MFFEPGFPKALTQHTLIISFVINFVLSLSPLSHETELCNMIYYYTYVGLQDPH